MWDKPVKAACIATRSSKSHLLVFISILYISQHRLSMFCWNHWQHLLPCHNQSQSQSTLECNQVSTVPFKGDSATVLCIAVNSNTMQHNPTVDSKTTYRYLGMTLALSQLRGLHLNNDKRSSCNCVKTYPICRTEVDGFSEIITLVKSCMIRPWKCDDKLTSELVGPYNLQQTTSTIC